MFLHLSQAAIWLTSDTVIWPGGLSTDGADQSALGKYTQIQTKYTIRLTMFTCLQHNLYKYIYLYSCIQNGLFCQ